MNVSPGLMAKVAAAGGGTAACCAGSYQAYNSLTSSGVEVKDESKPKALPEEGKNNISRTSQIPGGADRSRYNMGNHMAQTHFPRSINSCQSIDGRNKITKFDKALLDYHLNKKEINFKVSGEVEISEPKNRFEIIVSVDIDELEEGNEKTALKKLNGDENWTWGARISFSVYNGNRDSLKLNGEDKKSIDGFFENLKSSENKEFKSKFIDEIANSRTITVCENINGFGKLTKGTGDLEAHIKEDNKLITPRSFYLSERANPNMELYLPDDSGFKDWLKFPGGNK